MGKFASKKDLDYFGVEGSTKEILHQLGFGIVIGVACLCFLWFAALIA